MSENDKIIKKDITYTKQVMQRWEYSILSLKNGEELFNEHIGSMGESGWECYYVQPKQTKENFILHFYFKRPFLMKENDEEFVKRS